MPSSGLTVGGPSQSSASAYRSARRRSQVPEGGARTSSTHALRPFQRCVGRSGSRARRQLEELVAMLDPTGQGLADGPRGRLHVRPREPLLVEPKPGFLPGGAAAEREGPVVARRDEVDGRAKQGALHGASLLERARQVAEREAVQSAPKPEVRGRRVLRLEAADALQRSTLAAASIARAAAGGRAARG